MYVRRLRRRDADYTYSLDRSVDPEQRSEAMAHSLLSMSLVVETTPNRSVRREVTR